MPEVVAHWCSVHGTYYYALVGEPGPAECSDCATEEEHFDWRADEAIYQCNTCGEQISLISAMRGALMKHVMSLKEIK